MSSYTILGLMSGTSMDGLDISHVNFKVKDNGKIEFTVNQCKTYPYSKYILDKLRTSKNLNTEEILVLDKELGLIFAKKVNEFLSENKIDKNSIDAIASHGHTIHHQPQNGFTQQIGCGDTIAFQTGIKVINDFRQKDVIAGGQGAPLVPIGDKLLFGDIAEAYLNIGGFTNICIPRKQTIAFDICPGNLPLNEIVNKIGLEYDKDGELARSGEINSEILERLNSLDYYSRVKHKSLGTEWLENEFTPLLHSIKKEEDKLRTIVEHIAIQISKTVTQHKIKSLFITGGGALNSFLIGQIDKNIEAKITLPSTTIIDFKEALVFAFLGMRFLRNEINCLSSVTGASRDTIGGVLHLP